MHHMDKHSILTHKNHGFRTGYSCETQLLTTMHDLFQSHDAGRQTDVAVLDFSKAFDTVPHQKLLHKLDHYGIRGPILDWIQNFLTKRKMRVVLEGEQSEEVAVDSGVPQGTVLGPLLFLCHINDLPDSVKSTVRLFADDCLLYREIRTIQDHHILQSDLQELEKWASTWGMKFNAKKCYILSTKNTSNFFYQLNNTFLQEVQQTPYLGVQISSDLKWAAHIGKITKKASSTLGFLRRNLRNCPPDNRRTAFIALVRSTLEYGAAVWDPYMQKDIDKLERVQRQAARFIAKDYRSREPGCVTRMLQQHQLPPLQTRRKLARLNTMYKVVGGHIPALPFDSFLAYERANRRRIKPTRYQDFVTSNPMERYAINNSKGLKVPHASKEQLKNSFFVRTTIDWNELPNNVISAPSTDAFATAVHAYTSQQTASGVAPAAASQ